MLRSLFLVKVLGRVVAGMAAPAVTLASAVMFAPSASAEGVIVLGVDTTSGNSEYVLSEKYKEKHGIEAKEDGSGYEITTEGDTCAIENTSNISAPIPENNTIDVGGKTLSIVHNKPDDCTLRMSAGMYNPFRLKINGNLDIRVTEGEISSSDAIVFVNGEAYAPSVELEVTGGMTIDVDGTNIVAHNSGSYGVGIAEGDFTVGGDFELTMKNMSYRVSKWYSGHSANLSALLLGGGATDGETFTQYSFHKNLRVRQVEFLANPEDDVPTMTVTGVLLDDYGYTEEDDVNIKRTLKVEGDFSVENVSVKAAAAEAEAYGLQVMGEGASVEVSGATTISSISAETESGESAYAAGIEAASGAEVQLKGRVTIENVTATGSSADEAYALVASDGAKININTTGSSEKEIVIDGDVQINGSEAEVNMVFANAASLFKGYTLNEYAQESSATNITLSDKATWYVPGTNTLQGTLRMEKGGIADLYGRSDGSVDYTQLTVRELSGDGGVVKLRVNIEAETDRADSLVIKESSSGAHQLEVQGSGAGGKETMDNFLVQRQAGTAEFSLANPGEKVDIGVYNYALDTRDSETVADAKEWYLKRVAKEEEVKPDPDPKPDPEPDPQPDPKPELSPTGEAVLALTSPSAQTALFLQNLSTLRGRLGEIRTGNTGAGNSCVLVNPGKNGKNALPAAKSVRRPQGFYARTAAGQDHVPGFHGQDFRNNYWGGAVGYFRQANEQWLLGAEFNTMQGKQRLLRPTYLSKGESESYGMLASATWYNRQGAYWDFVVGFEHYEQRLSTHMLDGTPVTGTFSSFSPAVSVEWGRKFAIGHNRRGFIEPQLQLTYYRAGGDDYVTSNGMSVHRPAADSLTGRFGIAVGRSYQYPNGKGLQWHVDAGVLHEFCDDTKAVVNGESFTASSLGTRFYYGLGGEYNVSRRTQVYGYVGQEQGSDYRNDCKAQLGIRVTF